ncbi:putative cross-wall-targeting lipoprotein signal domain-containing proteiin [Paenibacillus sp. J31TS4]
MSAEKKSRCRTLCSVVLFTAVFVLGAKMHER